MPRTRHLAAAAAALLFLAACGHEDHSGTASAEAAHTIEISMIDIAFEPETIQVDAGDTGELTHTFTDPGTLEIGCHQPGHYEAGMKLEIEAS